MTLRHNDNGAYLHTQAAQPTGIGVSWFEPVQGTPYLKREMRVLPLYEDGRPAWYEHPFWRGKVDVAAMLFDVEKSENAQRMHALNDQQFDDIEPQIADDAFVLGYPLGKSGVADLPIWKRASIATEPAHDHDDLPLILVDTATSQGMSGGPVICRRTGIWRPRSAPPLAKGQEVDGHTGIGTAEMFLGVYSGRHVDPLTQLQLARVWKANLVEEICIGLFRPPYDADFHAPEEIITRDLGDWITPRISATDSL